MIGYIHSRSACTLRLYFRVSSQLFSFVCVLKVVISAGGLW
jgi:hypothetical protein